MIVDDDDDGGVHGGVEWQIMMMTLFFPPVLYCDALAMSRQQHRFVADDNESWPVECFRCHRMGGELSYTNIYDPWT
jgi:hypothetical protein